MALVHYRTFRPSADLAELVAYYWVVASTAPRASSQLVLPDGYTDLIFSIAREQHATRCALRAMGMATRAISVPSAGRRLTLGVSFRPGRARALFTAPARELTDRIVPFDALHGDGATRLLDRLAGAPSTAARIELLESFLRSATELGGVDPLVAAAGDAIVAHRGQLSLDSLTRQAGLGARQLRRRFERALGLGPKRFARIVRFAALADEAHRRAEPDGPNLDGADLDWASLALDYGFCDQAHMINEFRRFAGSSPRQHLARRRRAG